MDRLKAELMYERRTSEEHLSRFEDERRVWQEEKEKVRKEENCWRNIWNLTLILPTFLLTHCASLHAGNPLPEAAAAELHPDVPSKPGSWAGDEGAESGAGEQGHGGLWGPQWQQRHPLWGNHRHWDLNTHTLSHTNSNTCTETWKHNSQKTKHGPSRPNTALSSTWLYLDHWASTHHSSLSKGRSPKGAFLLSANRLQ